jgi:hypothetical protein
MFNGANGIGLRPIEQKTLVVDAFDCMKAFKSVIGAGRQIAVPFSENFPTGCGFWSC